MVKVAPSILAADFSKIEEEVKAVKEAGADLLHLDVMDGKYVPNKTFDAELVKKIRPVSRLFFDTHLMVLKPEEWVKDFAEAGSNNITFHVETTKEPEQVIKMIREFGISVGLCVNARIPVSTVIPFLNKIDLILVMSVNAGKGGQKFLPEALKKIKQLRYRIEKEALGVQIEVDGGINAETAKLAVEAGAEILVAGTYIFKSKSYKKAIDSLRAADERT